jgi:hypothetical protein
MRQSRRSVEPDEVTSFGGIHASSGDNHHASFEERNIRYQYYAYCPWDESWNSRERSLNIGHTSVIRPLFTSEPCASPSSSRQSLAAESAELSGDADRNRVERALRT